MFTITCDKCGVVQSLKEDIIKQDLTNIDIYNVAEGFTVISCLNMKCDNTITLINY